MIRFGCGKLSFNTDSTVCIIIAIPALSSAPRSVVPSVVIIVWPFFVASALSIAGSNTILFLRLITLPSYSSIKLGKTLAPLISVAVSWWAISPIVKFEFTFDGIYP